MRSEYKSNIGLIRDIEDRIRATKKYTEGVRTIRTKHPAPIQGEDFPSRSFFKYYEVYPEIDIEEIRPLWDAILTTSDWLWGDTPRIDVRFSYDYRVNKASIIVLDGPDAVKELAKAIPGFSEALAKAIVGGNGHKK